MSKSSPYSLILGVTKSPELTEQIIFALAEEDYLIVNEGDLSRELRSVVDDHSRAVRV